MKGGYLNTNSTTTDSLNPSDLAYPEINEKRNEMERIKKKILLMIEAPSDAKVIFNSGSTESIAQCIFWAKNSNPYGIVLGSNYDHSSVKDNCNSFDMNYSKTKNSDNVSMVFITHVDGKNGQIMDMNKMNIMLNDIIHNEYAPLRVLDAAQSFMKIPIRMKKWRLNAVFFSLHKIGGKIGTGCLVIKDDVNHIFTPLISGSQQNGLRGGTYNIDNIIDINLDNFDDLNSRKDSWNYAVKYLEDHKLEVMKPTTNHLYNTILIKINTCPLHHIHNLAKQGVYVGNISACANEIQSNDETQAIRLSFLNPQVMNESNLDKIVTELNRKE
jgi:cysteine sulfinate desulfinase/cysteine desulfurase-like protein